MPRKNLCAQEIHLNYFFWRGVILFNLVREPPNVLELHLESVFRFGIGRYFIGMRLTDII
jgi:hypothetical protein